ncbi:MAG: hypothetical protein SPK75_15225 [Victivallales bacterium]|nr:hypothetical protein [Victivallales bacterium]
MRIEEYKQRVVPETGKRDVPYAVREADFSSGLSIDPGKRLAEGAVKFGGAVVDAAGKISETLKKIQDEKDYLFTTGLTDELKTQLDTFQITEDSQSDAEKVEAMRKRMMMRIDSDRSISDAARANLTESVERKLQIFGAGLEFRRGEMVHKRNVKESYDRMGTAIQNGDFDAAMTHRAYLEKHLLPVPDAEEVRSKCILNRTVRSMEGAEYLVLYGQELELEEAIRAGTGLNGMNLGDTIAAKKKLKQRQAELSREMDEDFRKRFTDGKLDYANVKAAYDQGSVPVEVFNVWQRKFRELKSAEIINEADRNLNALKSRSLDDGDLKMVFEGLRMEVQESVRTGELSKEQGAELEKGLAERDFRRIRNKLEWGKKSKQDAENRFLVDLRVASDYPDDPVERKAWCREALNRAMKVSDDDSFLGKVQSRCNEILKEDVSYRQTPGYRLGMHVLEGYKDAFTSYAEPARRHWYTLGIKTAGKASPEITKTNYDVVKDKFAQWLKNNPNADEGMMRQWLDDQKKFINEQCVADLLSAYAKIKTAGPEKVDRTLKKVRNNAERENEGK